MRQRRAVGGERRSTATGLGARSASRSSSRGIGKVPVVSMPPSVTARRRLGLGLGRPEAAEQHAHHADDQRDDQLVVAHVRPGVLMAATISTQTRLIGTSTFQPSFMNWS